MNPPPTRLDKLELVNFRCFSKLEVKFHNELTVIVAPNGGGKTALLNAACLLALFRSGDRTQQDFQGV